MCSPPGRRHELPDLRARLQRGNRLAPYETVRLRKDGRPVPVALHLFPLRDRTGQVTRAVTVARDLTALKRAEEACEQAWVREQAARQVRDAFLATAAYALKAPLAVLQGCVQLLRDATTDGGAVASRDRERTATGAGEDAEAIAPPKGEES